MESVSIKANYRALKIFYGIFGLAGALIIGMHLSNYMSGEMMENWFLNFAFGLIAFTGGTGLAIGVYKPRLLEIFIDDSGISTKNTSWNQSFKWDKLKKAELSKNMVRVQFAQSGAYDSIGIPYLVRINNMDKLSAALTKACEENDIEIVNNLNKT